MQKQFVLLILLSLAFNLKAQFSDDFTDGNFTRNPQWVGDIGKFEINTAKQLHLSSSGNDTSVLVTTNSRVERTEWSFWVKLSFNTSANNYARVYLVSDNANLEGPVNGYFLQIGGSNDSLSFIKQTGTRMEKLFHGNFSCTNHSTNVLRLKMTHDSTGMWTLYADNAGGINFTTLPIIKPINVPQLSAGSPQISGKSALRLPNIKLDKELNEIENSI